MTTTELSEEHGVVFQSYRTELKEIDNGDCDQELRGKLERFYNYYQTTIIVILSNLKMLKTAQENQDDLKEVYEIAPFFILNSASSQKSNDFLAGKLDRSNDPAA